MAKFQYLTSDARHVDTFILLVSYIYTIQIYVDIHVLEIWSRYTS